MPPRTMRFRASPIFLRLDNLSTQQGQKREKAATLHKTPRFQVWPLFWILLLTNVSCKLHRKIIAFRAWAGYTIQHSCRHGERVDELRWKRSTSVLSTFHARMKLIDRSAAFQASGLAMERN